MKSDFLNAIEKKNIHLYFLFSSMEFVILGCITRNVDNLKYYIDCSHLRKIKLYKIKCQFLVSNPDFVFIYTLSNCTLHELVCRNPF